MLKQFKIVYLLNKLEIIKKNFVILVKIWQTFDVVLRKKKSSNENISKKKTVK